MSKCGWWNRWWHRRLRQSDVLTMRPAIIRAAKAGADGQLDADNRATFMWEHFKTLAGQEHWRCACARAGEQETTT